MSGKETLELKDVIQMLQNNELMKKTDSTKETSWLVVKEQRGDHRVEDPRRVPTLIVEIFIAATANNQHT